MVDIHSISAVLGSLKTATDLAKLIKESGTQLEQAEVKLKIAELVSSLADAKMEIADIQNLLIDKDQQITKLNEELSTKSNVVWETPYYWVQKDDSKDGPFCQHCFDKEKLLIRLQQYSGKGSWKCFSCNGYFRDKNYKSPGPIKIG
jgi:type IV secretory pathway VirB4 component